MAEESSSIIDFYAIVLRFSSFGVGGTIRRLDTAMGEGGDYKLQEDHVVWVLYELPDSDLIRRYGVIDAAYGY
ncbi:5'-3' exoribonuclease 3-like [Pyrus ussuriensis x Pyrus communis]|uniref:5'-3' exoribonuclease 3-like n=1 Tax=Pyrus ussuriensis x Pyrus communis TaxID=2448454 RepID=A0A5N5F7H1_9ROSA|nr:5'-3' exoribonuclease 3-like [Pyrus ussuriensis x Pyrus communis]